MSEEKKVVLVRSIWPKKAEGIIANHPWLVLVREHMSDTVKDMFSNAGIIIHDDCDSQERIDKLCKEYGVESPIIKRRNKNKQEESNSDEGNLDDISSNDDLSNREHHNSNNYKLNCLNRPNNNLKVIDQIKNIFKQIGVDPNSIDTKKCMDDTIDRVCKNPTVDLIDSLKIIYVMCNALNSMDTMIDNHARRIEKQNEEIEKIKNKIENHIHSDYKVGIKRKFLIYDVTIYKNYKPYIHYRTAIPSHTTIDYVLQKFHIKAELMEIISLR